MSKPTIVTQSKPTRKEAGQKGVVYGIAGGIITLILSALHANPLLVLVAGALLVGGLVFLSLRL